MSEKIKNEIKDILACVFIGASIALPFCLYFIIY
jgi:hypothetical protein